MANKIDSNVVGLRFAEETSLKTVSGSAYWYPLEPNSFKDWGAQVKLTAREPINATRQVKRGVVTDLDASGGFSCDLTPDGLRRLLQGFFFADIREKPATNPLNGAAIPITGVTTTYNAASGLTFLANHLIFASGLGLAANNGFKLLTAATGTALTAAGLSAETPPAGHDIKAVGYQFASATLDVVTAATPTGCRLNRASGVVDFTTLNLVPGEWIYVGGDSAPMTFNNNVGWARVYAVAAGYIDVDKTSWTPQAETGTGKTIQIFFGSVLKNENTSALIKRRSYQLERTLGDDGGGTQSEYLIGSIADQLTLNAKGADKVTADLTFVGCDTEVRTGATGVKPGTRPTLTSVAGINTSSDFSRIKISTFALGTPNPTPLFAFLTDLKIDIKNNVSGVKALATLGNFDATQGNFEVTGSMTAYFADFTGVNAIKNNTDCTIDCIMARSNAGVAFDIPLIGLGNGRLNVEKDQAVTIPLDVSAAQSSFDHTMLMSFYAYLPTAAC